MEKAKHIIFSIIFALFALFFVFLSIYQAAIEHLYWSVLFGFLAFVNIISFTFEMLKIGGLKQIFAHADKQQIPLMVQILIKKREEKERLKKEIEEDKKKASLLDQEIGELGENVEILEETERNYK